MKSTHLHDHTYRAEALKSINADKKISVDLEQISAGGTAFRGMKLSIKTRINSLDKLPRANVLKDGCYLSINVNNSIDWRILKSHSELIIHRGNFNRM